MIHATQTKPFQQSQKVLKVSRDSKPQKIGTLSLQLLSTVC